jgi:heptosyltransferase II
MDIKNKRILVIEPNWLGDILFTTPALRAIKRSIPNVFLAVMAHPRCMEMLDGNPDIDQIIPFDEKTTHRGFLEKLRFISYLKKQSFDIVISFHRSMTRMLIARLASIPRRIGYYTRKRSWLLTDSLKQEADTIHRVDYFFNLVKTIGVDSMDMGYEFDVPVSAITEAEAILDRAGIKREEVFFIINPGGNWDAKRWPIQNFSRLAKDLHNQYKCRIVVTGSEKDTGLASRIAAEQDEYIISICGVTNLKQLAAIMRKSKAVIANDSGPMHIAVSQGVPTVALFGPTSPKITGPYGQGRFIVLYQWFDCIVPCYKPCNDYRCMKAIRVEDVLKAVERLTGRP